MSRFLLAVLLLALFGCGDSFEVGGPDATSDGAGGDATNAADDARSDGAGGTDAVGVDVAVDVSEGTADSAQEANAGDDTGADGGRVDSSASDAGLADAGSKDAAPFDAGPADAGILDVYAADGACACEPYWCGCGRCDPAQIACTVNPPPCLRAASRAAPSCVRSDACAAKAAASGNDLEGATAPIAALVDTPPARCRASAGTRGRTTRESRNRVAGRFRRAKDATFAAMLAKARGGTLR
jgi:hypothetical protein